MNAKEEYLDDTKGYGVLCAKITNGNKYDDHRKTFILKEGYSYNEYEDFLEKLDFDYDEGFGGQELFGTIWYKDGTWSDRREYDGSEWWEHQVRPEIPKECSNE